MKNSITGSIFETNIDITNKISNKYKIENNFIYKKDKQIGMIFKKHFLYTFIKQYNINWTDKISRKLLPDNCVFIFKTNMLYIIECKYQECQGSADEKLQTCNFKKLQYEKLFEDTNIKIKYIYLLNDWFAQSIYKDVLQFIKKMNCEYYINKIPLKRIGL